MLREILRKARRESVSDKKRDAGIQKESKCARKRGEKENA
jgi:hypothetical protein